MASSRKPPSATFWITVALVVALAAYPLSFGPACWLVRCAIIPIRPAAAFYRPIGRSILFRVFRGPRMNKFVTFGDERIDVILETMLGLT